MSSKSNREPFVSVKDAVKNKILNDMFGSVPGTQKVLVIDDYALSVLGAACQMPEVMKKDIMLVEKLELKRQPLPTFPAIYFMQPTEDSVSKFLEDFDEKPTYLSAHLFFTSRLSDALFNRIKNSKALPRIRVLSDAYIDFLTLESQSVTLDMEDDIATLYPNASDAVVSNIADKIVTQCLTLGEYPFIRYSRQHALSQKIAALVQDKLNFMKANLRSYTHRENNDRGTLFILDRSFDCISPLVHEFTYQAMAYDLLDIDKDNVYTQTFLNLKGEETERKVFLDENDKVWVKYRHMHIADMNKLSYEIKDFLSRSKAASLESGGMEDLSKMSKAVKDMPKFTEMKNKYSLHTDLSVKLTHIFKQTNLERVGILEQNMITGLDENGEKVKKPIIPLTQAMRDPDISELSKLRLALIYAITRDGMDETERNELARLADLDAGNNIINKLSCLGVNIVKGKSSKGSKKRVFNLDYERGVQLLGRYTPYLQDVLRDHFSGKLSTSDFPYIKDVPHQSEQASESKSKSVRKGIVISNNNSSSNEDNEDLPPTGPRLMVFIAGGATYSEMRVCYDFNKSKGYRKDVSLGMTHIVTPKYFIEQLRKVQVE